MLAAAAAAGVLLCAGPAVARGDLLATDPPLYPTFDPTISDYVVRCTPGTPVTVNVSAPAGITVDVDGQGPSSGDFYVDVPLVPGQALHAVTNTGDTYYVRCLPPDFPPWTFERPGTPQAQWYTVAPLARTDFQPPRPGASTNYLALFDGQGVPLWWIKPGVSFLDAQVLPDGNVAWSRQDGGGHEIHRLDGSLVRAIKAVPDTDAHDMIPLPNGNYLVQALRGRAGFDVCGQTNVGIGDHGVEEIAPDGSVVWEWWPSDHIPMSEVPDAWCGTINRNTQNGYDVYHINSIEADGDGVIVSYRHLDAVYRFDVATGAITWKLGGVPRPESLTVIGDSFPSTDLFRGQHDARVLGDGSITVHDNGYHDASPRTPRSVRYAIDLTARTATLVEQVTDPDTFPSPLCCGSARRLAGGDWVIAWGSGGVITELTPAGDRVFKLTFDDQLFSYRSRPVPFGVVSAGELRAGMDEQVSGAFPRPRMARAARIPLVPAFGRCDSPNATHGPPLDNGSCTPPTASSTYLTTGTSEANGLVSNFTGFVSYRALLDDPITPARESDVRVRVGVTDVRWKSDLTDYTGELQVRGATRVTDRLNGPLQTQGATGLDTDFPVTVPCTATPSATIGATCSVLSTFNALVPSAVVEGKRAIWELGQVQVFDGGASGTAGAADATLFATQGLFVP